MPQEFLIQCFNCLSDFDAVEAIWCSCNPQRPTKVCPFCMGCFCAADQSLKDAFWKNAPATIQSEIATLSESRMLIGEMLVRSGLITTSQLLDALNRQRSDDRRLGEILVDNGVLPPNRLEQFLKSQHTAIRVDLSRARVDAIMLRRLEIDRCMQERILPLEAEAFRDRHIMTLVMADPSDATALERVRQATGYQVIPGVAPADAILAAIRSIYPQGSATQVAASIQAGEATASAAEDPHLKRLMAIASARRASHIQIQNLSGLLKVFYRIDGTLYHDRGRSPAGTTSALKAFKKLAGLEGEPRLVPRAARALVGIEGVEHPIIVRTRPGREGEEMSIKLIDPVSFPPHLEDLQFPPGVLDEVRATLRRDPGLILVSAPPFSGGSSTTYSLIVELLSQGRSLAVLESPRCADLSGTTQVAFFPEIRDGFIDALSGPEVMKAEVIAVTATQGVDWSEQPAGLTGSRQLLVRAEALTLPSALIQLVESGYPLEDIASRPTLVLHQRLVRKVCSTCRVRVSSAADFVAQLGVQPQDATKLSVWRGSGCDDCRPTTGFRGRLPLVQAMVLSPGVIDALREASLESVRTACEEAGLVPLRKQAVVAVDSGLTTPEEIAKRQLG